MATLEAGSRLENIAKSVHVFIRTRIAQGLAITVYYMGQDRVGNLSRQWVEADLMMLNAIDTVSTGPGEKLSVWKECIININCFEQLAVGSGVSNPYTLMTMSERVREVFLPTTAIPILDHAVLGTPQVGALMVWEMPVLSDVPTAPGSGIGQINIRVPLRYHEVFDIA